MTSYEPHDFTRQTADSSKALFIDQPHLRMMTKVRRDLISTALEEKTKFQCSVFRNRVDTKNMICGQTVKWCKTVRKIRCCRDGKTTSRLIFLRSALQYKKIQRWTTSEKRGSVSAMPAQEKDELGWQRIWLPKASLWELAENYLGNRPSSHERGIALSHKMF